MVCPDCGAPFDTEDRVEDRPDELLTQVCPNCGHEVEVALVYYPDETYEAIAPALTTDTCTHVTHDYADGRTRSDECGAPGVYRTQRVGESVQRRCVEHTPAHLIDALGDPID